MALRSLKLIGIAVLFVGCSDQQGRNDASDPLAVFEESPCPVPLAEGLSEGEDVTCGFVRVPERHVNPSGPTLKIAIAKVHSLSENPAPDPLVFLPGGPGVTAFGGILPAMGSPWGKAFRAPRDVIIFEQRGLYYSEPQLVCPQSHEWFSTRLREGIGAQQELERVTDVYANCRESLVAKGVNLESFNYTEGARDLTMVMEALDYDEFNVWGGSAGTLLAQRLLQAHSDRLRSVVIDSIARVDQHFQASWPAQGARNLQELFAACTANPACQKAYPDLGSKLERVVERLDQEPVSLDIEDTATRQKSRVVITGTRFAEAVFMMSWTTDLLPEMPALIHEFDQGNYERRALLVKMLMPVGLGLDDRFSWPLLYSVFCSESPAFTEDDIVFAGLYPVFEEAVANLPLGPRALLSVCGVWGVQRLDGDINQLAQSAVPTLAVSGEFDGNTPPSSGAAVAGALQNSYQFTIPGAGHSPIWSGPCPFSLMLQFLEDPSRAPDGACVSDLRLTFQIDGSP